MKGLTETGVSFQPSNDESKKQLWKNVSDRIVFAFHAIMLDCRIVCKSHFPIGRRHDDKNDVGDNYDVDSGGNENDDGDDDNYETRWIWSQW